MCAALDHLVRLLVPAIGNAKCAMQLQSAAGRSPLKRRDSLQSQSPSWEWQQYSLEALVMVYTTLWKARQAPRATSPNINSVNLQEKPKLAYAQLHSSSYLAQVAKRPRALAAGRMAGRPKRSPPLYRL